MRRGAFLRSLTLPARRKRVPKRRRVGRPTAKPLHNKAQGRDQRERTLGGRAERRGNPNGVAQAGSARGLLWNPFRVRGHVVPGSPGCAHFVRDPGLCCPTPVGVESAEEPSRQDIRLSQDYPETMGPHQFVISRDVIYHIDNNGAVSEMGATSRILGIDEGHDT